MSRTLQNIKNNYSVSDRLIDIKPNVDTRPSRTTLNYQASKGIKSGLLFSYIIGSAFCTSLIVLLIQLYSGNHDILIPTLLSTVVFLIVYFLHSQGYKSISYWLFLGGMNFLNIYMVAVGGSNFQAVYCFYLAGLGFTFIYFKQVNVLITFMVLSLLSQIVILYYNSDANLNGITADLIADGICLIAVNILIFLMCYFILINLGHAKGNLELTTADLKKQHAELKERTNQLDRYIESNIQLENYTHLAAHELKAPLKAVKGFADILKAKVATKLDDKETEMFNFISAKTNKMEVLLNDLTSLGMVSQSELTKEHIDLEDLFRDILIDRNDLIKSRHASLDIDLQVNTMVGQYGLIKQLFSNLIGNAIKFVDESKYPKVVVKSREKANEIVFEVIDNGIGIKPIHRNRIFQIFERLHAESEFKGSGIGLSISKKIVDLHKGTIEVKDSELGGSCFVVNIPKLEI